MEKVLVLVSGGPDSVYLLNYLVNKRKYDLIILHINYHQRPESGDEAAFVKKLAKKHNLPVFIIDYIKGNNNNFQKDARNFRYHQAKLICKELKINNVFVGHHKDDNYETIMLQKARNNKTDYVGLVDKVKYQNFCINRPLLDLTKKYILKQLKKEKITYCIDSSNNNPKYLRNKIRLQKITFLKRNAVIKAASIENTLRKRKMLEIETAVKESFADDQIYIEMFYKYNEEVREIIIIKFLAENKINLSLNKVRQISDFIDKRSLKTFVLSKKKYLIKTGKVYKILTFEKNKRLLFSN